jgi:hypothetical protein
MAEVRPRSLDGGEMVRCHRLTMHPGRPGRIRIGYVGPLRGYVGRGRAGPVSPAVESTPGSKPKPRAPCRVPTAESVRPD